MTLNRFPVARKQALCVNIWCQLSVRFRLEHVQPLNEKEITPEYVSGGLHLTLPPWLDQDERITCQQNNNKPDEKCNIITRMLFKFEFFPFSFFSPMAKVRFCIWNLCSNLLLFLQGRGFLCYITWQNMLYKLTFV